MILGSDGSDGLPRPALFSAVTLKWYSSPSFKSLTTYLVSVTDSSRLTTAHRIENLSFFSIRYVLIGLPPSDGGADHERLAELAVVLFTLGFPGASGTSLRCKKGL